MLSVVEMDTVDFEVRISKFRLCIFAIFIIISPWKRTRPFIRIDLNPLWLRCFVPSLVKISHVVLESKMKMWKFNNGQISIKKKKKKEIGLCMELVFRVIWVGSHSYITNLSYTKSWIKIPIKGFLCKMK